jgi:hypothetical protein
LQIEHGNARNETFDPGGRRLCHSHGDGIGFRFGLTDTDHADLSTQGVERASALLRDLSPREQARLHASQAQVREETPRSFWGRPLRQLQRRPQGGSARTVALLGDRILDRTTALFPGR